MSRPAFTWSAALAAALFVAASVPAQVVHFRSGDAKLRSLTTADQKADALRRAAKPAETGHILVQFSGPVSLQDGAALAAAGIVLQDYLAPFAFFAAVNRDALNPAAVGAVAPLLAVETIQRNWKLHPFLASGQIPQYALSGDDTQPDQRVAIYIQFHRDAPMGLAATKIVQAHGGIVRGELMSLPVLVAEVPRANLPALADEDSIMWIEPAMPVMEPVSVDPACAAAEGVAAAAVAFNDSNRPRVQADIVQAAPYSLDGTGVNVFVFDGGIARTTHQTFAVNPDGTGGSRATALPGETLGIVSHSTHVSGTIGGNGAGEAGNTHKGMAPNVRILTAGLATSGCTNGATGPWFLYNCTVSLTDMENDYSAAINHATLPAAIASNSIGTNTSTNGFPCSLEGDYGITDALIDNIVRGSLGRPFRVVWANGNERQSSTCLSNHNATNFGGYYLTAPPATAKNHITVGALNSNDDSMTSFSSWGPTDDGRLKPDVSGPGCQVGGDGGVTSSTSTTDITYGAMCGTSMACPTTAGISALIVQDFRAHFPAQPDPRNSTLKILLAHNAVDLVSPGPDYQSGYGSVRVQNSIDFLRTGRFLEDTVNQGGTYSTTQTVVAGIPLKVTLAWDDVAGTPNSTGAAALVNDLDLRLIDPNSVVYFPWTLDPAVPSAAAVRTVANHRDNIEQVVVDNPVAGQWTIQVAGFNVPAGPQLFSLAIGSATSLSISVLTTLPTLIAPGQTATVDVSIVPVNQSLVPGSPAVFFRTSAGPYSSQPLTFVSGNTFRAVLAAPPCNQTLEFYFTAAGSTTGTAVNPGNAPTSVYSAAAGALQTRFSDNFQTNQGWTVTSAAAGGTFAGPWERGTPIASTGGPSADADGSGQCFVTGLAASTDVDFGSTTLTSPIMDASGSGLTLSYFRWFHRSSSAIGSDGLWDQFLVETSTNGGTSWITLEVVGQASGTIAGSWILKSFPITGGTNQFRVRFTVNDNITNSTAVEGGVDVVKLTSLSCTNPCPADWDHDGTITPADVAAFVNAWLADLNNGTTLADFDGNGSTQPADVAAFVTAWFNALNNGC